VAIDLTNLRDQAGIIVGHADDIGSMTGRCCPPRHFLEQPGPKRVQFAHLGHVELDGLRMIKLCRNGIGERLQRRYIGGGPGSAWAQFKHIA
jgi:hypothetical protein